MGAHIVRRDFVNVGTESDPKLLHYYVCGEGPAVILLHPSPASASSFLWLLPHLANHVTAIAIDTPGYGYSDEISSEVSDLRPYVDALEAFRVAMDIDTMVIYGSATGTQIAIEYSKAFPHACGELILDSIADFPTDEYHALLDNYFQDLSVDPSGSHLMKTWGMILDLMRFFPWHDSSKSGRLAVIPFTAEIVEAQLIQFLQAGAAYDKAYRVAFANERAENIQSVETRTTIIRSSGSLIKRYADRLDNYQWPDHILMHHCGPSMDERRDAIVTLVANATTAVVPVQLQHIEKVTDRQFISVLSQNCFVKRYGSGNEEWLIIHDIGSSSTAVNEIAEQIGESASVIAPDLPEHGATDVAIAMSDNYVVATALMLQELLDTAGIAAANILAVGESAAIALELQRIAPHFTKKIVLLDPLTNSEAIIANPVRDGSHLAIIWHALRNRQLYYPRDDWTEEGKLLGELQLDAETINQQALDFLRSRKSYSRALRDTGQYRTQKTLAELNNCIVVQNADMTSGEHSRRNFRIPAGTKPLLWHSKNEAITDVIGAKNAN